MEADVGPAGPTLEGRLQVVEVEVGVLARCDARLVLEQTGGGQRAERHEAFGVAPHVPGVAVEAVDLDVGDEHPHLLAGLAGERDAGLLTDPAVPRRRTRPPTGR